MTQQAARTSPCGPIATRPANATSSLELVPQSIASRRSFSQGDVPMIALPRSLATLVVALTLIAGYTPALAAKRHSHATTQSPPIRTDAQVVAACRWRIRTQVEPTFDAYLNPGAQLGHYFGPAPARVQFDHCMSEFGKPRPRVEAKQDP